MTSNSQAHRRSLSVLGRKLLALLASAKSSTSDRRIQVIEGRRWVPIVAPKPTLSSAPYGWDGILVERYNSVKVLEDRERTRTTVIVHLHLGAPAQQEWPLGSKRKRIPVVPGNIQLLPPGPSRSARIEESTDALVFSIEPTLLAQALGESWPSGSVELTAQIGLRDSQLESLMRALRTPLARSLPQSKYEHPVAGSWQPEPFRSAFPACGWCVTHGISPQSLNKSEEPNNCPKNGTCRATVRASILEPRRNAVVALLKTRTELS
jgi:hypothetical protein